MMEVQQRLACLSPTQRLSAHPSPSSLRQLSSSSPLTLPLPAAAPSTQSSSHPRPPSSNTTTTTMIIEASLHASTTTPPDSPQQGETMPNGISEDPDTNFSLRPDEAQSNDKSSSLAVAQHGHHKFQAEPTESHSLWSQGSEMPNGVDEFSQGGMAREGVEEEGSAESPPQTGSPRQGEDVIGTASVAGGRGDQELMDRYSLLQEEDREECYTPPAHSAGPHTPSHPDQSSDRRNRRKQTIEDIVRRIATSETEPEDEYQSEEIEEESDAGIEMEMNRSLNIDDEVDGTPLEISRQILNAQACAESAIKQTLHTHYDDREGIEGGDEEDPERFTPLNFLHPDSRKDAGDGKGDDPRKLQGRSWEDLKNPHHFESEFRDSPASEKKPGVTILPKTVMPPHMSPNMGGLHSSMSMSPNISESAYSPHHFSSPAMNKGWFQGAMPHLFPFSPAGLMDHPMGHKFLPYENKMIAEVDKDYLKCNYCERTFRRQKNLENHVESTHQGKGGQRPKRETSDMYFKCTHCPYTTKHQSNLYVHLRIHTGERPYICGACGVQYSQSHSLKSHIINKHDGHMNYYIKEKRNRSPRGMGYMATHMHPGDPGTIFKMPPPPALPGLGQGSMEHMAVARAIEMASKNSMGGVEGQAPPPLLHPQNMPPTSMPHQHSSPMVSPNGPMSGPGHHGLFSKPGFPFNGHFGGPGMPFMDLPANPSPAMIPHSSPGSHLPNGTSPISPINNSNNSGSGGCNSSNNANNMGGRSDLLNLSAPVNMGGPSSHNTPTSSTNPGFSASNPSGNNPNLLSPAGKPLPSPNNNHNNGLIPNNNNKVAQMDCGAMDLSTRGGQDGKGKSPADGECADCPQGNKLKLLRLNVVRMLSILVPNLNFEEKGISADSDSVDELLQDVIESNTHDDDMVH